MKAMVVAVFVVGGLAAGVALAADVQITEQSVVFLYEARAEVRVPVHKLAEVVSGDYRAAQDEFTRHELMRSIEPVIERRLEEARTADVVFLLTRSNLGEFDFEKGGFPTGVGDDTFWRMRSAHPQDYVVRFRNAGNLAFLPVSVDSARSLAGDLRTSRSAILTIHGDVEGRKRGHGWLSRK